MYSAGCNLCANIIRLAALPPGDAVYEFKVGSLSDLQTSSCTAHKPITDECEARLWLKTLGDDIRLTKRPMQPSVAVLYGPDPVLTLAQLPKEELPGHLSGYGRKVDSSWLDISTVREWRVRCDEKHTTCRNGLAAGMRAPQDRPSLLIDTQRMCIVQAEGSEAYLALSYVWGNVAQLTASKTNILALMRDNTLASQSYSGQIPRTIRDAIGLVPMLGERYLWVDSLCIIQDDEISKHRQINAMAAIYSNATLTIVASEGSSAETGLRGIIGVSEPRDKTQRIFSLDDDHLFVQCPPSRSQCSTWATRGWTMQESLLSTRKLLFCSDTVEWQCLGAMWREDVHSNELDMPLSVQEAHRHTTGAGEHLIFASPWPAIHEYGNLVMTYSTKSFTYAEDILPAFSGLATALSITFDGGFLYGIPEMFFDVGLLWVSPGQLQLRDPRSADEMALRLPSWSWMGWVGGKVDFASWNTAWDYYKKSSRHEDAYTSKRTIPLVRWHYHEHPGSPGRIIPNHWRTYVDISPTDTSTLPTGWSIYKNKNKRSSKMWSHWVGFDESRRHILGSYDLREPDYFFKHESDSESEFWYPIPVVTGKRNPPPDGTTLSVAIPLISCATTRAFMKLGEKLDHIPEHKEISIRDESGCWMGLLELNSTEQVDFVGTSDRGIPRVGEVCELVVISRGFAYNDWWEYSMREWDHEERPQDGEKYEWYNVLWVEWHVGIARRKALGRVHKKAWEEQELEDIELFLN